MGAFISLLLNVGALAAELSAETAISVESILTGEALAALEAEIASVMTIQGISGIEALTQLGFTAEQFSNFSLVSSLVNQALQYAFYFQTVSGAAALVEAGIKWGVGERSVVDASDVGLSPNGRLLREFAKGFKIDPFNWSQSLIHNIGRTIFEKISAHNKITQATAQNYARLIEMGRWYVEGTDSVTAGNDSGISVAVYPAPGGAEQRATPDWLLPLILGLSGDTTPTWKADLEINGS